MMMQVLQLPSWARAKGYCFEIKREDGVLATLERAELAELRLRARPASHGVKAA